MERVIGSMILDKSTIALRADDLKNPCNTVDEKYQEQCYRNQVTSWSIFFKGDVSKIGAQCTAIEKKLQAQCFESIGYQNVMNVGEKEGQLVTLCGTITDSYGHNRCLIGEMKELLFEGKSPQLASRICGYIMDNQTLECSDNYSRGLTDYRSRFGT